MKTSIIEVGGLLSALSARGVEKQLSKLPGVWKIEVNYVAGSATVLHDETVVDLKAIKARVQECGYRCSGERMPKHVCVPEDPTAAALWSEPQSVAVCARHSGGHLAEPAFFRRRLAGYQKRRTHHGVAGGALRGHRLSVQPRAWKVPPWC